MPDKFPDSLFIPILCAHAVFEISAVREWHNPSETSSDVRGDQLEQSYLSTTQKQELSVYN